MTKKRILSELKESVNDHIFALAIVVFCLFLLIECSGCSNRPVADESTLPRVVPVRVVSPRCVEVAEEVEDMRHWCSSTMIAPSRARESCRFVEEYERECL